MRKVLIAICLFVDLNYTVAQEQVGLMVKTNVLNLIAKRPSIAIDKTFANRYSLGLSYASGALNFGRTYEFEGILMSAKIYTKPIKPNEALPFYGIYVGRLSKTIVSVAEVHNTGYLSFGRDRNFKANSVRGGATMGLTFIPKKHFVLETSTNVGYGKYYNVKNQLSTPDPKGYFDFQMAISIGYLF